MEMKVLPRADDITLVVLSGRLDSTGAEEIAESFSQATAARERPAIVDMSQVDFLASRGISVLLASCKSLLSARHKLVLLNPQSLVESSLRTARLDIMMPIAFDLDEAIRIAEGGQTASTTAESKGGLGRLLMRRVGDVGIGRVRTREGELKLTIKNEFSELQGVMTALSQFLGPHCVPHRAEYALNLAVDELVTNVMRYAYVDDDPHLIDLEFAIRSGQIILQIVDDGRPFDPRTGPALDLHAEERQVGGLGLLLVLDMVDSLKYQRKDDKNWVEVRIQLSADDEAETDAESITSNEDNQT